MAHLASNCNNNLLAREKNLASQTTKAMEEINNEVNAISEAISYYRPNSISKQISFHLMLLLKQRLLVNLVKDLL
jgi:hypothetical protein